MQIKDLIPWARKDHAPEPKTDEQNPITTLQRDMNRVFENFWNASTILTGPGAAARSALTSSKPMTMSKCRSNCPAWTWKTSRFR